MRRSNWGEEGGGREKQQTGGVGVRGEEAETNKRKGERAGVLQRIIPSLCCGRKKKGK